jgi:hypothetical protein
MNSPWFPGTITVLSCKWCPNPHWHATRNTMIYDADGIHKGPVYELCPHEFVVQGGRRLRPAAGKVAD